jgi:hypothetical protein
MNLAEAPMIRVFSDTFRGPKGLKDSNESA